MKIGGCYRWMGLVPALLLAGTMATASELESGDWTSWTIPNHYQSKIDVRMKCARLGWRTWVQFRNREPFPVRLSWQAVGTKAGAEQSLELGAGDFVSPAFMASVRCEEGLVVNVTSVARIPRSGPTASKVAPRPGGSAKPVPASRAD